MLWAASDRGGADRRHLSIVSRKERPPRRVDARQEAQTLGTGRSHGSASTAAATRPTPERSTLGPRSGGALPIHVERRLPCPWGRRPSYSARKSSSMRLSGSPANSASPRLFANQRLMAGPARGRRPRPACGQRPSPRHRRAPVVEERRLPGRRAAAPAEPGALGRVAERDAEVEGELRRDAEEGVHAGHDRRVERRRDGADPERPRRQHEVLARGQDGVGPARRLGEGEDDAGDIPDVVGEPRRGAVVLRVGRDVLRPGPAVLVPALRPPGLVIERAERAMRARSVTTRNRPICRLPPLGARTAASKISRRSAERDRVGPEPPDRPLGEHGFAHRHAEPPSGRSSSRLLRERAWPCAGAGSGPCGRRVTHAPSLTAPRSP